MPILRPRISVDQEFWEAFVAVCRSLKIDPSAYIERSLRASMLPFTSLHALNRTNGQIQEMHDKIDVLADYIVDRAGPAPEQADNTEENDTAYVT